ncbi:hypothetical protein GFB56_25250 [Ensifer sp. T173]|uniref:Uncharacterized protein n=1 Tax=Ensifer canadensis TaxID=555315 RepID=A0AAW4FRV4_9HYPH|nr:hypothetical protein [Ensifer canadensis]MBM3094057.1 hypothetical protein [Ensifer canadensis]UBI81123.1 hypothetical protein J3R84_38070 [Ensifer canadensis]
MRTTRNSIERLRLEKEADAGRNLLEKERLERAAQKAKNAADGLAAGLTELSNGNVTYRSDNPSITIASSTSSRPISR